MRKIEQIETGENDKPVKDVIIAKCGALVVHKPFPVARESVSE